ncbi:MAG: hypothetical protein AB7G13_23700 [Lautropia sp.]
MIRHAQPAVSVDPFDPRGVPGRSPVEPAPRRGGAGSGPLLLVDNGKLGAGYGPYAVIADVLRETIAGDWRLYANDLLRVGDDAIDPIAEQLAQQLGEPAAPRAAVLALADAGVSVQTALLAMALERRGVPTVVLATPLGARVVEAIYAARAPELSLVAIDTVRTDTQARLRELLAAVLPAIRAAMTERPRAAATSVAKATAATAAAAVAAEQRRVWSAAAEAMAEFQHWATASGIGDGLPLMPPSDGAIRDLLASVPDDPGDIIYGPAVTSGRSLRVHDAAVNAVMAGCAPAGFPVVLAALRAVARPGYRLSQAAITTHPSGNAIVFAGGDPRRYGMASGAGCLGPGASGNPAIGRAVSLAIQHVFGARPGGADLSAFGSPAELTYCLAESADDNPWPSLARDFGDGSPGVLVTKAEAPRNVLEHLAMTPRGICEALAGAATSICSNNAYIPGDLLVFVNPEHAAILAEAGWGRTDVAEAIHALARLPRARLEGRCIGPIRPRSMDVLEQLPVTRSPRDVHVVVAGGRSPQSMVALPWGYSRSQWQPIATAKGGAA